MRRIFFPIITFLAFFLLLSWEQQPKKENPYGLEIVADLAEYKLSINDNQANALIDLEKVIPGIVLDIRYATTNNLTHQAIYPSPKAFVRKPVVEALLKIQEELKERGIGLKILDAYRPYEVTLQFFKVYPDTNFVASPRTGSKHNRGCAVDLTLINLKSGHELEMPTAFDDFSEKAYHSYQNLPLPAKQNRQLLREVMTAHGFIPYESEWWHYDYQGWHNFKLTDLSFNELSK